MNVTIDDIFKATGQPQQNFLSRRRPDRGRLQFQLTLRRFSDGDQDFLKRKIDENRPVIALVNYAGLVQGRLWRAHPEHFCQDPFCGRHRL